MKSLFVSALFLCVLFCVAKAGPCIKAGTYFDIHDGDIKTVTTKNGINIIIKSFDDPAAWSITADLDEDCSAMVDFNVPNKPNPPPVKLLATVWTMETRKGMKHSIEFTDPSGTIAAPGVPLNVWIKGDAPRSPNLTTSTTD